MYYGDDGALSSVGGTDSLLDPVFNTSVLIRRREIDKYTDFIRKDAHARYDVPWPRVHGF
jgi:hypothetical protein